MSGDNEKKVVITDHPNSVLVDCGIVGQAQFDQVPAMLILGALSGLMVVAVSFFRLTIERVSTHHYLLPILRNYLPNISYKK